MKNILILLLLLVNLSLFSCNDRENNFTYNTDKTHYASLSFNSYDSGLIYGQDPIMYLDYQTMDSTVLCSKPNCDHRNSECVAKVIGDCPILYNNYIYFFKSSQNVEETGHGERKYVINSKLCRISIDSSEMEDIVYFTDCVPREYDGWIIKDNTVWFTGDDMNPTLDEYGNISASNQGGTHYMCGIDLNKKEYTNYGSVYDGDKIYEEAAHSSSAQIKGLFNSKIIIRYEFAKAPISHQSNEDFDYRNVYTELMFEFDPETKELNPSNLKEPTYVDKDIYVYNDDGKTFVIDGGNVYECDTNSTFGISYINGILFDGLQGKWFDISNMSEHSMGKYTNYKVVAFYDNNYILVNGAKNVKLTKEELLTFDS